MAIKFLGLVLTTEREMIAAQREMHALRVQRDEAREAEKVYTAAQDTIVAAIAGEPEHDLVSGGFYVMHVWYELIARMLNDLKQVRHMPGGSALFNVGESGAAEFQFCPDIFSGDSKPPRFFMSTTPDGAFNAAKENNPALADILEGRKKG